MLEKFDILLQVIYESSECHQLNEIWMKWKMLLIYQQVNMQYSNGWLVAELLILNGLICYSRNLECNMCNKMYISINIMPY